MSLRKLAPADIKQIIADTKYNEALRERPEKIQKKTGQKNQNLKHEQDTSNQEPSGSKPLFPERRLSPESLKIALSHIDALAKRRNLPPQNPAELDKEFTAEELESLKKLARTI